MPGVETTALGWRPPLADRSFKRSRPSGKQAQSPGGRRGFLRLTGERAKPTRAIADRAWPPRCPSLERIWLGAFTHRQHLASTILLRQFLSRSQASSTPPGGTTERTALVSLRNALRQLPRLFNRLIKNQLLALDLLLPLYSRRSESCFAFHCLHTARRGRDATDKSCANRYLPSVIASADHRFGTYCFVWNAKTWAVLGMAQIDPTQILISRPFAMNRNLQLCGCTLR